MAHNVVHLAFNIFFALQPIITVKDYYKNVSFTCEPYSYATNQRDLAIARTYWLFYLSKYTDCFETVLFVARKRSHMVNSYHLFHHSMMPFIIWVMVKYFPSGHSGFFGNINPWVHIVYYSYYMTKQLYPPIKQIFWWFRTFSITFQVGQFFLVILHALQLLFRNPCNYPMSYSYFVLTITTTFYLIFMYQYKWRKGAKNAKTLG